MLADLEHSRVSTFQLESVQFSALNCPLLNFKSQVNGKPLTIPLRSAIMATRGPPSHIADTMAGPGSRSCWRRKESAMGQHADRLDLRPVQETPKREPALRTTNLRKSLLSAVRRSWKSWVPPRPARLSLRRPLLIGWDDLRRGTRSTPPVPRALPR